MGNRKLEILETLELWNIGTLEHWNSGTLEPWNSGTFLPRSTDLNPLTGNLIGFDHRFYCSSSPNGEMERSFAIRFTLYAK